jgi:hypothetical protein
MTPPTNIQRTKLCKRFIGMRGRMRTLEFFGSPGVRSTRLLIFLVTISSLLTPVRHAFTQDWIPTSAPTNHWRSIAASADGTKLLAVSGVGLIHASTNSGMTWNATSAPDKFWSNLASSADGTKLLALGRDYMFVTNGVDIYTIVTTSRIYTSSNSGANWMNVAGVPTNASWTSAASSADGVKLAASSTSSIYTSTNAGGTWILRGAPNKQWNSIASSADGTRLVAVAVKGGIFTSVDSGATWIPTSAPTDLWWWSVGSSADGVKLVAVASWNAPGTDGGPIYVSTDAGTNWVATSAPTNHWISVSSSADASTLVVVSEFTSPTAPVGVICISRDSGATWTLTNPPNANNSNWHCVAASADGDKLFAGLSYGGIHVSQALATPQLNLTVAGNNPTLSWIIPSMDFVLQETDDLTLANWTDVTTLPTVTNYQYQVAHSAPLGNRFFRLKGP